MFQTGLVSLVKLFQYSSTVLQPIAREVSLYFFNLGLQVLCNSEIICTVEKIKMSLNTAHANGGVLIHAGEA